MVGIALCLPVVADAQPPVGALAVDEGRGEQYGWAVDYESASAARAAALRECGSGCRVVLTFERCGAYAADQASGSTAYGWGESYASADGARERVLSECRSRGGTSCLVRAWGCNGPVVEEELGLDRTVRRQIQLGLRAAGYDPGGADGLFGPRTRASIRSWQTSRGARATGYLDGAAAEALRMAGGSGIAVAATAAPVAQAPPPAAPETVEVVFWQSIADSTNPADFEAYLAQFPNGVFRSLAQNRLTALRQPSATPEAAGTRVGGAGSPTSGSRVSGADAPAFATASAGDARRRPGEVFRDCAECPEMVVLPGGRLAMGRYEVMVGEYRAFAAATGHGAGNCIVLGIRHSWRSPGFPQTDRHPVTCVSWDDAQAYVSWLSRTTGTTYRLPTEAEWDRAAAGSVDGCGIRDSDEGTCPVGASVTNAAGLLDMVGNLWEWTEDCWEGNCGVRVVRGGSWFESAEDLRPASRTWGPAGRPAGIAGFRVSRALD